MNNQECLPQYWTLPMLTNFARHTLHPNSVEYIFVSDKFFQSWADLKNQPFSPAPNSLQPRTILPVPVPSTNNPPSAPFLPGSLQGFNPGQVLINNSTNNRHMINQSSSNLGLGSSTYSNSPGTNALVIPPLSPPSLANSVHRPVNHSTLSTHFGFYSLGHSISPVSAHPLPPPVSSLSQQMPGSNMYHGVPRIAPPLPRNTLATQFRRTKSVAHNNDIPQIIQIERIQNQRWYKQYSAHECEFRQKLGKQTEQWLFHG